MDADWKAIAKVTLLWKICAQLPLPSAGLRAQKYRFFFSSPSSQEDYDYLRLLRALRDVDVFQGMCDQQFVCVCVEVTLTYCVIAAR